MQGVATSELISLIQNPDQAYPQPPILFVLFFSDTLNQLFSKPGHGGVESEYPVKPSDHIQFASSMI